MRKRFKNRMTTEYWVTKLFVVEKDIREYLHLLDESSNHPVQL